MRIVITGGAGFLGVRLARKILERGTLTDARGVLRTVRELVLLDVVTPPDLSDSRVRVLSGDLTDAATIERALTPDTDSIFHLAAVVSGQAEADFDIGMRVNLDATRLLLERCRHLDAPPNSCSCSLAVFGGVLRPGAPTRRSLSPGLVQRAEGDGRAPHLRHDAKGFVDGRSLRLPTVTVGRESRTRPLRRSRVASSASRFPASMRSARLPGRRACG
jgi:nucleoside-diphosphate-sugar epimerase